MGWGGSRSDALQQMINYCLQHGNIKCFRFFSDLMRIIAFVTAKHSCYPLRTAASPWWQCPPPPPPPSIQSKRCLLTVTHTLWLKHFHGYQCVQNGPVTYTATAQKKARCTVLVLFQQKIPFGFHRSASLDRFERGNVRNLEPTVDADLPHATVQTQTRSVSRGQRWKNCEKKKKIVLRLHFKFQCILRRKKHTTQI